MLMTLGQICVSNCYHKCNMSKLSASFPQGFCSDSDLCGTNLVLRHSAFCTLVVYISSQMAYKHVMNRK